MNIDQELSAVLGDSASTLLTDFSIESILDRVVETIAEILPVSGSGLTLIPPTAFLRFTPKVATRAFHMSENSRRPPT